MPLTQARMDHLATRGMALAVGRQETVTYRARTTASGAPIDHPGLSVVFEEYSTHYIAMQALLGGDRSTTVLREDRRIRIPTAEVTWTPTVYDEVVRANDEHWRVMDTHGGPGNPFWQLQGRRLPPTQSVG